MNCWDEVTAAAGLPLTLQYIAPVPTRTAPSKPSIRAFSDYIPSQHSLMPFASQHSPHYIHCRSLSLPFLQYHNTLLKDLSAPSSSIHPTSTHSPTTSSAYHSVPFPSVQYNTSCHTTIAVPVSLLLHVHSLKHPAHTARHCISRTLRLSTRRLMYHNQILSKSLVPETAKITTNIVDGIPKHLCKYVGSI
jgi:hypothetical protein